MKSFGVECIEIPFQNLSSILKKYGVNFEWDEKDRITPEKSLKAFRSLSETKKKNIAKECLTPFSGQLVDKIKTAVAASEILPRNVQQIELLVKTDKDEYVLKKFLNVTEVIHYLLSLTDQKKDVGRIIGKN
ncbi:MAG: hypothetical protein KF763_10230 [Cyclobacteriaceae bacterium]|nr:hypothetical protein [Cyclobacteriaceae bacterium]